MNYWTNKSISTHTLVYLIRCTTCKTYICSSKITVATTLETRFSRLHWAVAHLLHPYSSRQPSTQLNFKNDGTFKGNSRPPKTQALVSEQLQSQSHTGPQSNAKTRSKETSLIQSQNSSGKVPVKVWLREMLNVLIVPLVTRRPSSEWNVPDQLFAPRESVPRDWKVPISDGMGPVRILLWIVK